MRESIKSYAKKLGSQAREAALQLRSLSHQKRVRFLRALARLIKTHRAQILKANSLDLAAGRKAGLTSAMLDRLTLNEARLNGIEKSVLEIAALPNPLGKKISSISRPDKLTIERVSVPIGTILFIFESRPNVTIDGAALCVKSGNAVILRGGKESFHSNHAFGQLIGKALKTAGLPQYAVQLVKTPERKLVPLLLRDTDNLDVVIPRGGEKLIQAVVENSRIPVIKHYKGLCHVYIDGSANPRKAREIAVNAKVQRPGVCNAMETLLIDKKLSRAHTRNILEALQKHHVELRGDASCRKIMPMKKATDKDWSEEYLDAILSVREVNGVGGAINHIKKYGSGHTDSIVAESKAAQQKFMDHIDSSSVMVNASTRFSDGGEYGLGAEVGISTDKLHARGPMGIESLTTYQWIVRGTGHVRK